MPQEILENKVYGLSNLETKNSLLWLENGTTILEQKVVEFTFTGNESWTK
jgi:hypothetical protein